MMRKSGFTLIELLVVIAIISLLAAILLPALMRARDRGRLAACITNQRQVTTAVQIYADEHQETFPGTAGGTGPCTFWDTSKINRRSLICPSSGNDIGYSYSGFVAGRSHAELADPTQEVLLADGDGSYFSQPIDLDPRHNGGLVTAFCDGHVEFLTELPPMWLVHLTDPAEYDFEAEKTRYPVMLVFYDNDLPGEAGEVTKKQFGNKIILDAMKNIAKSCRLNAKVVLVELSDVDEKLLREDFFPINYSDVKGEKTASYPSIVILDRGKVEKVISPPPDTVDLLRDDNQVWLEWWRSHIEEYKGQVVAALEEVCKKSKPWAEVK